MFQAFVEGNGSAPFRDAPTPRAAALTLPKTLVPGAGAGAGLGDGDGDGLGDGDGPGDGAAPGAGAGLGDGDEPAAGAGAGASPPPPPQAASHSAESAISAARRSLLFVMRGLLARDSHPMCEIIGCRCTTYPSSPNPGDHLHIDPNRRSMQAVALMEAVKGLIVLGAGFGLLTLLHRDVASIAVSLVTRLHIDPSKHYAGVFLDVAERVTDARLWLGASLAALYSALRFAEGYGLWFERAWGVWLGVVSGGIYVPVEVYELWHKPSWVKAATLTLNVAVVAYLIWRMRREVAQTQATAAS